MPRHGIGQINESAASRSDYKAMNREQFKATCILCRNELLRSLTGLGGGAVREVSDVLLPSRVRRSRLNESLVESTLRCLIEEVGQIRGTYPEDGESLPPDFLVRRTSLLTIRSP
jgi:hypothetical protein